MRASERAGALRSGLPRWRPGSVLGATGALALILTGASAHGQDDPVWTSFVTPPPEARPLVRWWWFGPAVTDVELDREITAMRQGGFGGFEVQPVYPLTLGEAPGAPENLRYLSPQFLARLRHAAKTGRAQGLRVDVTLGSGWPFGGPHVTLAAASALVRLERAPLAAGQNAVARPKLAPGENLLSAARRLGAGPPEPLALAPGEAPLVLPPAKQSGEALFFIAGHTGQKVKRAALGAEGLVIDHASATAVQLHLAKVGAPLLSAFAGEAPPDAVFSDSLEAYGASWTPDLPEEFRKRRGYDLLAHLPALFLDLPESAGVRFDWARTLSELVEERYLAPIDAWARAHGTRFRAQVYGYPPPTLSSNRLVAIPEGEGADWRDFTSTRWATSGAHLYGKPVVSSEVWTWLHSPAWAATPLDMKVEADRHFLQGVTQLVGHGWPYSAPGVPEPGWAFYAAAALNDHNPWYAAMPAVTAYLARLSWLLRQGEPANSAAIYLPTEDAMAAMTPEATSINEALREHLPKGLVPAVLDAGYGFDFVDAGAIKSRRPTFRVLVLPALERIDAEALEAIADWAEAGGHVVVLGALPQLSGGLLGEAETRRVRAAAARLARLPATRVVPARAPLETALAPVLHAASPPDLALAAPEPEPGLGFVRRHLAKGDALFLVNTTNRPLHLRLPPPAGPAAWWDPMTGTRAALPPGPATLDLAPYESRVLVTGQLARGAAPHGANPSAREIVLGRWTLARPGASPVALGAFTSWSDEAEWRHVSGTATYTSHVTLPKSAEAGCWALDFGTGHALDGPEGEPARPRARIEAPVREAAIVTVNGMAAGTLWAPPYRLNLGHRLAVGSNTIEVATPNSALNVLSGQPRPDRSALTARFGERFTDQDTDRIAPTASGLLAPVRLVAAPCP
ncbi:glycoside hydrolase [Novosphingobium profundi]|uniref:glycosyl hydrolase n=1 Tax=Novosphingobium profundi TaxID=1774954 RepID=UPI001BDB3F16|nr:glycosyl hydrolase [Novosphingobium profundi]MBT0669370.1 glycoside hydrolase [Novosphingobium profundi]